MTNQWWVYLAWVLAAGVLGFAMSAIFSNWLRLSRRLFLVPYFLLGGVFLHLFFRWSQANLIALLVDNWYWGVLAGLTLSAFLVRNILSQPASARSEGGRFLFDVAWVGLGYGALDSLFLNIMPVVAVLIGFGDADWAAGWTGKLALGGLGLVASLFVTLLYHAGYPEFRDRSMVLVLVGNALITLAYLVSGSALGALISHVAMHVAAVFRGPETMVQLPPHYPERRQAAVRRLGEEPA